MSNSIQTPLAAGRILQSIERLNRDSASLARAMSSGSRIQSAADDAAGVALSVGFRSRTTGLAVASRNTMDAIGALQTADGGMADITALLQRMRELAVQSSSGTLTSSDRAALQHEFQALRNQIGTVATQTRWNGANLLDGSYSTNVQVGADVATVQRIAVSAVDSSIITPIGGNLEISGSGTLRTTPLYTQNYTTLVEIDTRTFSAGGTITATIRLGNGSSASSYDLYRNAVTYGGAQNRPINSLANAYDVAPGNTSTLVYNFPASTSDLYLLGIEGNWFSSPTATNTFTYNVVVSGASQAANVTSAATASASLSALDSALGAVNAARASVGAQLNSLAARASVLGVEEIAGRQSLSTVVDLDYAAASAELARQAVLRDAATSVLVRSHDSQRMALTALQNLRL